MALRRNAPDKVKLKMRGDGRPDGDLGQDLIRAEPAEGDGPATIRDQDGRLFLDWSGGNGAAALGQTEPLAAERVLVAGLNALAGADPDGHARLAELTRRLADGLQQLTGDGPGGTAVELRTEPGLLWLRFEPDPGQTVFERFTQAMRSRGIRLPPSPDFPWLVTLAHDRAAVDRSLMAATDSLGEIA